VLIAMKTRFLRVLLMLLSINVATFAHHGTFVSYDSEHPITMKATMTEFHFTNPHMQLYFDVTDDKGNVTHWSAEGPDPAVWVQGGWGKKRSEAALAPGTKITITLGPARNGKPVGSGTKIVLENGEIVGPAGGGRGGAPAEPTDAK
jgi:Family of unknown function (DUF6152)